MWNLCNVETNIISVERIQQYTSITSEADLVIEEKRPPQSWPSQGTIELQKLQVCVQYHEICFWFAPMSFSLLVFRTECETAVLHYSYPST